MRMIPGSMYELTRDQTFYIDINDMSSRQRLRGRCGDVALVLATYRYSGVQNLRLDSSYIDERGWVWLVTYLIRGQIIVDVELPCYSLVRT